MATKAKITANGTYVFDPEEIEQLDELSLTSMIAAIDPSQPPGDAKRAATEPGACAGDTTINTLLEEPTSPHELPPSYMDPLDPPEQPGDLIAPELIFTEPTPRRR